ncbi:hypothetical protein E4T38_06531 [Aureobasidium subglaciale]|nr:hypothetical protein E4T38_06531 [Aureobasidium subglaciale]KAI5218980.1 hypothetical protein E4T40_06650 [Aureobasidium subglaciale]KAI5222668.1 hypothetical protein E4T41_06471 [Aureobasidium subglaciale]KAI5260199.1 hypothetical protein E4T46_06183 [Aureobasidium subglaciale]
MTRNLLHRSVEDTPPCQTKRTTTIRGSPNGVSQVIASHRHWWQCNGMPGRVLCLVLDLPTLLNIVEVCIGWRRYALPFIYDKRFAHVLTHEGVESTRDTAVFTQKICFGMQQERLHDILKAQEF